VHDITDSFKDAIGGAEGREQLKAIFDNLQMTSEKLSSFADVIDRSVCRNEDNIDSLLSIGTEIRRVAEKLERDVFPSFQTSVEKISTVFDRDISRIAAKLESTAQSLEEASVDAREGFRSINSVAEKIDEGKGLFGKLVNEDETYHDLKVAVHSFRDYLTKFNQLQVIFDSHFETMHRPAENYVFEDSKGYFDVRLHFSEDYFYVFQLVSSQKGYRYKKDTEYAYYDIQGNLVEPNSIALDNTFLLPFYRLQEDKFKRNTLLFGFQFGKIFNRIALRVGLFENSAGLGVDIDIPFKTDKFRWVTTLEVFDMSGWNRKNDRRPHIKWLNRMFFLRNLYFTFGADDFASKRNASAFLGAGLRFGDDDVKYLLSSISGVSANFISS
jgi:phospholipid/cholesterol/gamma-HCH transport system substrate-binding protein